MQNSAHRLRFVQWLTGITIALLLGACQTPEPVPAEPEPPDPAAVNALVASGDAAADREHWDNPLADSALDYYQRALVLDPDHLPARRRIEAIVERYLTRARSAAERHSHAQARSMLARARLVDAEHPGIAPANAYLEMLASSERQELPISSGQLRDRDASLTQRLARYGGRARSPECRTLIRAGNDADGRWIYQQMAQAAGEGRIRAQFEIGRPAMVALLCNA